MIQYFLSSSNFHTCFIFLSISPLAVNAKGSTGVRSEFQTLEVETDLPYVAAAENVQVGPEGKKYDYQSKKPEAAAGAPGTRATE